MARELLIQVGASDDALRYVSSLTEYARKLYLSTLWIPDRAMREAIGLQICIHGIGVKLLDDIMDHEASLDVRQQILGVYLTQAATANLCKIASSIEILEWVKNDYKDIWRNQSIELNTPPTNLETWLAIAKTKTGQFLACYCTIACIAAGMRDMVVHARTVMEAVGVLYTAKDDLEDFGKPGEGKGNLVNILTGRAYSKAELDNFFLEWYNKGCEGLIKQPTITDIHPTLVALYNKCLIQSGRYTIATTA